MQTLFNILFPPKNILFSTDNFCPSYTKISDLFFLTCIKILFPLIVCTAFIPGYK